MIRTIGRAVNGLPLRTAFMVVCALNQARYRDGGTFLDPTVEHLALRIAAAPMGGAAGPVIDRSFRAAALAVWGTPQRWGS